MKLKSLILALGLALVPLRDIAAANESADVTAANADGGAVFSIEQPDSMFVPYGEYPHKRGLQLFDRAAAEQMVASHNSLIGKLKRMVGVSYPVYVGHPDVPGSQDTDKRAWGWIESIVAENDGARFAVKWSAAGRDLIENAHYKYYSPHWWMAPAANGKGFRPKALISVGLTNTPNIPVPSLANERDPEEKVDPAAAAAEADPAVEETATEEVVSEEAVVEEAAAEEEEAAEEQAEVPAVPVEILTSLGLPEEATLKQAIEAIQTFIRFRSELESANEQITALDQAVAAAANDAVQAAVAAGRLTPADAAGRISALTAANDFAAALQGLRTLPAVVKTLSVTGDLGGAKVRVVTAANDAESLRRDERKIAVANEYAATNPAMPEPERRKIAHARAATKNPSLFSNSPGSAA